MLPNTPLGRVLKNLASKRDIPLRFAPVLDDRVEEMVRTYQSRGYFPTHAAYGNSDPLECSYIRLSRGDGPRLYRPGATFERIFLAGPERTIEMTDDGKLKLTLDAPADALAELRKRVEFTYNKKTLQMLIKDSTHGEYDHLEEFIDAVWK